MTSAGGGRFLVSYPAADRTSSAWSQLSPSPVIATAVCALPYEIGSAAARRGRVTSGLNPPRTPPTPARRLAALPIELGTGRRDEFNV